MYAASRDRSIYAWNWPEPEPDKKEDGDSTPIIPEKDNVCNRLISEPSLTLQGHTLGVTALANNEGNEVTPFPIIQYSIPDTHGT